jgi:hypothetical protein
VDTASTSTQSNKLSCALCQIHHGKQCTAGTANKQHPPRMMQNQSKRHNIAATAA